MVLPNKSVSFGIGRWYGPSFIPFLLDKDKIVLIQVIRTFIVLINLPYFANEINWRYNSYHTNHCHYYPSSHLRRLYSYCQAWKEKHYRQKVTQYPPVGTLVTVPSWTKFTLTFWVVKLIVIDQYSLNWVVSQLSLSLIWPFANDNLALVTIWYLVFRLAFLTHKMLLTVQYFDFRFMLRNVAILALLEHLFSIGF